jgi:GT2 family glycosyltransferase
MSDETTIDPVSGRRASMAMADLVWETLLWNDGRIRFVPPGTPLVSIVIVSFNAARLLAMTLSRLAEHLGHERSAAEVIVVDNASDAETQRLLDRIDGGQVIRNAGNQGFGPACNQGAAAARGRYVFFMNPDIDLMPGAIDAMVAAFSGFDRVGIVGARLVFPGGYLQEAGASFRDDAALTHPHLRSSRRASAPEVLHLREVAYVSGAALMVEAALFAELGGFDPLFAPAYFEDTDLCVRAVQHGFRVVYQPRAVAFHYENATAPKRDDVERLLDANRRKFLDRHRGWLFGAGNHPAGFMQRDADRFRFRLLYIDDYPPHVDRGAGLPRANSIVNAMARLGYLVTVLPCHGTDAEVADRYRDIDPRIEVLDPGTIELRRIIDERKDYYDALWVSRPHNIGLVVQTFLEQGVEPSAWVKGRVIFDTEAVFACRDAVRRLVDGASVDGADLVRAVADELALTRLADTVVCVSPSEELVLRTYGALDDVRVLGHTVPVRPGPSGFAERRGVVFVGPLVADDTPNVDSIAQFLAEVWPRVTGRLGADARLVLVGEIIPSIRARFEGDTVEILGRLDRLDEVFDRVRLAIAPTRFAAGIPEKVHNTLSHGLPTVVSPILGAELGWPEGDGFVSAPWQDPAAFADAVVRLHEDETHWRAVRQRGLARVAAELGAADFSARIRDICEDRITS